MPVVSSPSARGKNDKRTVDVRAHADPPYFFTRCNCSPFPPPTPKDTAALSPSFPCRWVQRNLNLKDSVSFPSRETFLFRGPEICDTKTKPYKKRGKGFLKEEKRSFYRLYLVFLLCLLKGP